MNKLQLTLNYPSEAEEGESVHIYALIKNVSGVTYEVMPSGFANAERIFGTNQVMVDHGDTVAFMANITMPNSNVGIDVVALFRTQTTWWEDDGKTGIIELVEAEPDLANLTGYVSIDGYALENVTVTLLRSGAPVGSIKSDSYGEFSFIDVYPATYEVDFAKTGYQSKRVTKVLLEGNNSLYVNLEVVAPPPPPPGLANLTGYVSDTEGNGLSGVTVTLLRSGAPVGSIKSDSYGEFSFIDVYPATYEVDFAKTGYQSKRVTKVLLEGNNSLYVNLEVVAPPPPPPPPECMVAADCPAGYICQDGVCVLEEEPPPPEKRWGLVMPLLIGGGLLIAIIASGKKT